MFASRDGYTITVVHPDRTCPVIQVSQFWIATGMRWLLHFILLTREADHMTIENTWPHWAFSKDDESSTYFNYLWPSVSYCKMALRTIDCYTAHVLYNLPHIKNNNPRLAIKNETIIPRLLLDCHNCQIIKVNSSINPQKTKIVHYRPTTVKQSTHTFLCGNQILEYSDSYRYLGLWMNEHLDMQKTVKELSKSASRALGVLCTKFKILDRMPYKVYTKL